MFKDRLATILKDRKISQSELAKSVECSRQAVCDWLAGKSSPKFTMLVKIATVLGVTTDELLADEANQLNLPKAKMDNIAPVAMSEECQELIRLYNSLPVRSKIKLLQHAYILNGDNVDNDLSDDCHEDVILGK